MRRCDRSHMQKATADEDDGTPVKMHSQSAIEVLVQGSGIAANQQMRNCNNVSFRQTACSEARPRSLGPPLHSRRFPSFPFVSPSFLVVSQAFRLGSASIAR